MVEDNNPEILKIVYDFPAEIRKIVINGNLDDFKKYVEYYEPINKDLIHAFIYFNYVIGASGLFGIADIADAVLEVLDKCDIKDSIALIEKIYILYSNDNKIPIVYDGTRILVRLLIGTMTVNDVIEEEKLNPSSKDFPRLIDEYLNYLEEGINFDDLHFMISYDYRAFINNKQSNITSHADASQKIKGLYCAHSLYRNKQR